jgi:RNA polymerase subunit RPABC4/transcription elongation factor Spt4
MVEREKVCRTCRLFVQGDKCPLCGEANFSKSWKGTITVHDPAASEIAQKLGIKTKGRYCIWVK